MRVTGIIAPSSSGREVEGSAGCSWKPVVVKATSACNTAETWVQPADFLHRLKK